MGIAQKMLCAGPCPFHGPAERPRGEQDRNIFRKRLLLHPEAAAHVSCQHAHLRTRNVEDLFAQDFHEVLHALARRNEGETLFRRIPYGQACARLHRRRD